MNHLGTNFEVQSVPDGIGSILSMWQIGGGLWGPLQRAKSQVSSLLPWSPDIFECLHTLEKNKNNHPAQESK